MYPHREAVKPKSVVCTGILIVEKLEGCKVEKLLDLTA